MNGPDHYREAERLMKVAEGCDWQDGRESRDGAFAERCIAAAQAHAALAQVAATMDVAGATSNGVVTSGWGEVLA